MLPTILTTPRVLAHTAERFPEQIAVQEGDFTLTYQGLHEAALRVSRALLAHGIKPGDRVAIWAPNCHQWIVAALGIHCAGAVLVPINTRMKGMEAGDILERSRARILFSAGTFLGTYYPSILGGYLPQTLELLVVLDDARNSDLSWDRFLRSAEAVTDADVLRRAEAVTPSMLSDVLFTSGTTGTPKGVMTAHGQNLRNIADWARILGLTSSDRYLLLNPFFHVFGYKNGILASVLVGATMLPQQIFDAEVVLERIGRERVSVFPAPPTVFHSLLTAPTLAASDLSSLRATITGAASIPPSLIKRMRDELGFSIVLSGYGQTECCGAATMCRPADDVDTVATTSGRSLPGVELRIADPAGSSLPSRQQGEILIRGYNVMQGYIDDVAGTEEVIDGEGWLHTGDIGWLDPQGYLHITDRLKDMFINGGFNCYPAEIERFISAHPSVKQVAVIGVPDPRLGEVGCAFVVLHSHARVDGDELISWCRDRLANYKVPRYVEFVDELPINAAGKVLKRQLVWPRQTAASRDGDKYR